MTIFKKLALATGAVGLVTAPAIANVRVAAPVEGESELKGQGSLFTLVAIAVVAASIVFLNDSPASP